MISIVVLTFNNFEELVATLESTRAVADCERIVINAGKCEKTLQYLQNAPLLVKAISEPDQGIADGFNKGVRKASGEFITFLNSGDVLVETDYYEKAVRVLKNDPTLSYVHSNMKLTDSFVGEIHLKPSLAALSKSQPYLFPTMVFRRDVFERIGFFNLKYRIAMDFDLIVRMRMQNLKGYYLNEGSVILMDGLGVSNRNEMRGVNEAFEALSAAGLLGPKEKFHFFQRGLKLRLKSFLMQIKLNHLISFYKRLKHRKNQNA